MYEFRLQSVLKYRENLEKKHIQEMSALQYSLAKEEAALRETVRQVREISEHFEQEGERGVASRNISVYNTLLKSANARIAEQEMRVNHALMLVERKRLELIKTSQGKKILEKLKIKEKKRFFYNLARKNQKETDDIAAKKYRTR